MPEPRITIIDDDASLRAALVGLVRSLGYKASDFVEEVKRITDGRGVDMVLDMVAGDYVDRNYDAAAVDGRIVQIATLNGPKGIALDPVTNHVYLVDTESGPAGFTPPALPAQCLLIEAARPDVMVVAAYGLILPAWVLQLPRLGCLNIHASLLPRWRGAAPIHRAIEAGDRDSGITIMQMDAGLDTGDMLLVAREPIEPQDSTASLHDRLATLGGQLMVQALAQLGQLTRTPQPAEGITYAHKIEKHEAPLDWRRDAHSLARQVRAFDPFPGAQAQLGPDTLKVWQCEVTSNSAGLAAPGTILAASPSGVDVATGQGVLRLLALQRPGGRRLAVADALRGHPLQVGQQFELPAVPAQQASPGSGH